MARKENWRGSRQRRLPFFPPHQLTNFIDFSIIKSVQDASFLQQKYVSEDLSPAQIGELTFSSRRTVLKYLEQFKIPLKSEDQPRTKPLFFGEKRVNGRVLPHQQQIKTLEMILKLRETGFSLNEIVDVLNSAKTPTQTGKGKWHLRTVHSVLQRASAPKH